MNTFLDRGKREVKVGDFIIYTHSSGRSAVLQFGRVLSIESIEVPIYFGSAKTKPQWRIGVRGVYESNWDGKHRVMKPGTLQYPSRIILANDFMPQDLKDLYGPAESETVCGAGEDNSAKRDQRAAG